MHPHRNCSLCGQEAQAGREDLIRWFIKEGWRESKQELVEQLLKHYNVTKKESA